ncbi:MAG: hypothetical protein WC827_01620 [Candidatus Paceibacterota bacterium]|jgi:hypothetical protein
MGEILKNSELTDESKVDEFESQRDERLKYLKSLTIEDLEQELEEVSTARYIQGEERTLTPETSEQFHKYLAMIEEEIISKKKAKNPKS